MSQFVWCKEIWIREMLSAGAISKLSRYSLRRIVLFIDERKVIQAVPGETCLSTLRRVIGTCFKSCKERRLSTFFLQNSSSSMTRSTDGGFSYEFDITRFKVKNAITAGVLLESDLIEKGPDQMDLRLVECEQSLHFF